MHELSLAQALVDQLEAILDREAAASASAVTVAVGALSGVDADAFAFAFPLAAEGTRVEHARLTVVPVPARVRCRACGKMSEPDLYFIRCTHCGSGEVDIEGGREFTIRSVELPDPEAPTP